MDVQYAALVIVFRMYILEVAFFLLKFSLVKGLLTMGMFWGDGTPVSRSEFDKILMTLTSIITVKKLLSEFYVSGNLKSTETCSQLLECFTNKLLPRVAEIDGLEKVLVHFAMSMWNQIETYGVGCDFSGECVEVAMATMREVVGVASVGSQNIIIHKAYSVISASKLLAMGSIPLTLAALEGLEGDLSARDELILSLFASVSIAASPSASIPDVKSLIRLLLVSLLKGYIPAAQALGSMVNKLGSGSGGTNGSSDCSFEELYDIIFHTPFASGKRISSNGSGGSETNLSQLCLSFCAITGIAWIGKGLLMRGDERVNETTLVLVECLKSTNCPGKVVHPCAIKHAADAFSIVMSDSEVCLNRKLHAVIRPFYKQRFFFITVPVLEALIINSNSPLSRTMSLVALTHVISNVPVPIILDNTKKILEGLSVLSQDSVDKETLFSLLLILSGTLTGIKDKNLLVITHI